SPAVVPLIASVPCARCVCLHAPAPPAIYTLSLHDALPIWGGGGQRLLRARGARWPRPGAGVPAPGRPRDDRGLPVDALDGGRRQDRKSTRLNSSHVKISYAVFCLKKKKKCESEKQES